MRKVEIEDRFKDIQIIFIKKIVETNTYYLAMKKYFGTISNVGIESDIAFIYDFYVDEYRELLIEKFNAFQYKSIRGVFFKTIEDAENALDYLEGTRLMAVLNP